MYQSRWGALRTGSADAGCSSCMLGQPLPLSEEGMRVHAVQDVLCNEDLLKLLFTHLGLSNLCTVGSTCRQWRQVAESDEFWTALDFSGLCVSPRQMVPLLQRHPNVRLLNLKGVSAGASLFQQNLPALTRLTQLSLGDSTQIRHMDISYCSQLLPALKQLNLYQSTFASEDDGMIVSHTVQDVLLEDCHAWHLRLKCPKMTSLSLNSSKLGTLMLENCTSLRSLDLQGVRTLSARQLLRGVTDVAHLTSLNMRNQPELTDETVRAAATQLSRLQELQLSSCNGLTLSSVRGFPALTHLDLSCCEAMHPNTALVALESFTRLESLLLDGCIGMSSVALNLPFLRHLSLDNCTALTQVDLRCPSLRKCSLEPGLEAKLKQVHLASRSMQSICWRGLEVLSDVHIACPSLKRVELLDCEALEDSIFRCLCGQPAQGFNAATSNGSSLNLRELRVERCAGLSCCQLASSSVRQLSIADCPGLHTLCLLCPALQRLELEECKILQQVELKQVGLRALCLGTCPSLTSLIINAPHLCLLDLKGCNVLQTLELDCPQLSSLDATFCTQLDTLTLSRALGRAPRLHSLVLSVCVGLEPVIPTSLPPLANLSLLDLSYTGIQDLEGVADCCPGLTSLNISSCRRLQSAALACLLPPPAAPTPLSITSVDTRIHAANSAACSRAPTAAPSCLQTPATGTRVKDVHHSRHQPAVSSVQFGSCNPGSAEGITVPRAPRPAALATQPPLAPVGAACDASDRLCHRLAKPFMQPGRSLSHSTAAGGVTDQSMALPQAERVWDQQCALPSLISLDVSYCSLPADAVCSLLQHGHRFQDVAMNGCWGVTDALWHQLHLPSALPSHPEALPSSPEGIDSRTARQHALQSLSLVGCKGLRCCYLGLIPPAGLHVAALPQLPATRWTPAACRLSGLQSLKLGLLGVRTVALALSNLTALDMNGCSEVRHLELRCPKLLTAYFQACGSLTGSMLRQALQPCKALQTLDIQHISLPADTVSQLQQSLPGLKSVLHVQRAE